MKKLLLPLLAAATALGLTSCFQSETVIHLNKDGSGTIVEETTFGAQATAMMSQMSAMGGEEGAQKDPLADMFSEDKAKTKATTLGEGVIYEKTEKIDAGGKKGARVTYKFADINKVKFTPGDAVNDMKPAGVEEANPSQKKNEPVTFTYANGKLVMHLPQPKPGDKKPEQADAAANAMADAQQEAMMKQMFADMKVAVKVMAHGGIASSDASHVQGDTITLMEMDFGKVVNTPGALKKLTALNPETPEEIQEALKGIDGIKVETKPEVTVTLK